MGADPSNRTLTLQPNHQFSSKSHDVKVTFINQAMCLGALTRMNFTLGKMRNILEQHKANIYNTKGNIFNKRSADLFLQIHDES